jgi:cobalt-zinc-cadmium efflux system membrane fusion protein
VLLAVIGAGALFVCAPWLNRQAASPETANSTGAPGPRDDAEPDSAPLVHLTDEQLKFAALHTVVVGRRDLQQRKQVAGHVRYNEHEYLPVTAPVKGIVRTVHVVVGQKVAPGDTLAVVSSAEIGAARSDVQLHEADLRLAERAYTSVDEITQNVEHLLEQLDQRPEVTVVEEGFRDRLLGEHRGALIAAYSRLRRAESELERASPLAQQGVVSGRVIQERQTERETAAAQFASICETTRLQCRQQRDRARVSVEDARRRVAVSRELLAALAGTNGVPAAPTPSESPSDLVLCAPIRGEVTQRLVRPATRVDTSDLLFVIANTDVLWITAEVRENDWQAVSGAVGQEVRIEAPAVPDLHATARICFVGSSVSEDSLTLPMTAELADPDHQLKPGFFVWVSIPVRDVPDALAVPAGALARHNGAAFVFVCDGPGTYRRQDVQVGLETPDWVEIQDGLHGGETIVDEGVLVLKSELLLEKEAS